MYEDDDILGLLREWEEEEIKEDNESYLKRILWRYKITDDVNNGIYGPLFPS